MIDESGQSAGFDVGPIVKRDPPCKGCINCHVVMPNARDQCYVCGALQLSYYAKQKRVP